MAGLSTGDGEKEDEVAGLMMLVSLKRCLWCQNDVCDQSDGFVSCC